MLSMATSNRETFTFVVFVESQMNLDLCKRRSEMNLNFLIFTKNILPKILIFNELKIFCFCLNIYIWKYFEWWNFFIVVSGGHVSRHICGSTKGTSINCILMECFSTKMVYKMHFEKKKTRINMRNVLIFKSLYYNIDHK